MESLKGFSVNQKIDLGQTSLSEQEIIDFAKAFDPLEFHTNPDVAKKSPFKGIIASGPHIFTVVHKNKWIPIFGETVIAGIELNNWKFLLPIYPEYMVQAYVTITSIKPNKEKGYATITWLYEFMYLNNKMVQSLEIVILHKIS